MRLLRSGLLAGCWVGVEHPARNRQKKNLEILTNKPALQKGGAIPWPQPLPQQCAGPAAACMGRYGRWLGSRRLGGAVMSAIDDGRSMTGDRRAIDIGRLMLGIHEAPLGASWALSGCCAMHGMASVCLAQLGARPLAAHFAGCLFVS